MAKAKTVFFCTSCGYESSKWMGQCPACHEWNTFSEEKVAAEKSATKRKKNRSVPLSLSAVDEEESERFSTEIEELDRVLGGGVVRGSLTLIGGDPGIGKSTILLQVCRNLSLAGKSVLYVSGEESPHQIKMRAKRLGDFGESLKIFCETDMDEIEAQISKEPPEVLIIDSIQTMYSQEASSAPGSVSQVRLATGELMKIAKTLGISVFVVGHVTKEGAVAGPKVLEHMVDTVLYFEGDRFASYRVLRSVKNRFGSTNEIGVFEMRSEGLCEVKNPSEFLLGGRAKGASGSAAVCSVEGTRPIMLEIQALVCRTSFGLPRRTAAGADLNRVNLIMAVLEKRAHLKLSQCDTYVNITGGIKVTEPAIDLGLALAVASGYDDVPIPEGTMCFGEVGLSGEIRAVSQAASRVREAARLGFSQCIMPAGSVSEDVKKIEGIRITGVRSIGEAIDAIRKGEAG